MFLNKVIILFLGFFASLVFALPEDAKQPIEIEADSVFIDGFCNFSSSCASRRYETTY